MDYYTETIQTIRTHIEQNEVELALEKLIVELSMPYIPLNHQQTFESMLREVQSLEAKNPSLYTDIDEIKEALHKSEAFKSKALNSLESLNLRMVLDDLVEILQSDVDDLSKRFILMMLFEQEIDCQCDLNLEGEMVSIDTKKLENPLTHNHYQKIFLDLDEMLSSYDPSLLELCYQELSLKIMESFPFINESLNAEKILENVNSYMNNG